MEQNSDQAWAAARLSTLTPEWSPDPVHARARLNQQMPRQTRWAMAAAVAAALLVAVALPQGRLAAQEVWYRLFFRGVEAVRIDLSRIPLELSITSNGRLETVTSVDEAARLAGYRPVLPKPDSVAASGEFVVTSPLTVKEVIHVRKFESALAKAGAGDVRVPPEWEGIMLRMELGPMVIATYANDVQIVQSRPGEIFMPAGFPLAKLAEAAFRCTGLSWWQARAMGEKYAANPTWLLDIPEEEVVKIEEIRLRGGPGLLIEDPAEEAGSRVTVFFSTSDRLFAVSSASRGRSVQIADALH